MPQKRSSGLRGVLLNTEARHTFEIVFNVKKKGGKSDFFSFLCIYFFYLCAVFHVPLVLIYKKHVGPSGQAGGSETNKKEQPGAEVADHPESKLHLKGSKTR